MSSGQRVGGFALEDLFDPDIVGNGPVATGYRDSNGQPLRFAHIQYGARRSDVGRRQNGSDLAALWAAKGTAAYSLAFQGGNYARSALALTNQQGSVVASVSLTIGSDGTWAIYSSSTRDGSRLEATGGWLTAGAAVGDYEVQFSVATSNGGGGSVSNGAPGFQNASTSRSVGISATAVAASTQNVDHAITVVCNLRRISTGHTTVTSCSMRAAATGWG